MNFESLKRTACCCGLCATLGFGAVLPHSQHVVVWPEIRRVESVEPEHAHRDYHGFVKIEPRRAVTLATTSTGVVAYTAGTEPPKPQVWTFRSA